MGNKKNFLNYELVQDFLKRNGGEKASDVVKLCVEKKYSNDEKIGNTLKTKVTEIRTILNRLHYCGVAQYSKTRNKQTGWYSYSWKINEKKILQLLIGEIEENMGKLEKQTENVQERTLFMCKNKCSELVFEIAMQYNFQCPECGQVMNAVDEKKRIKEINKQLTELEKTMKEFENKL